MVWQGPRLGFVAETGRIVTMDALSTISCFLCLATYFYHFLLPYPCMFVFFVFLRLCSIHLLLSASAYFVVCVLVSFVSCLISESVVFYSLTWYYFFRSSYFSGGVFLFYSRTRCASTWFAYLDFLGTFAFSLSHCDHRICISLGWRIRKDTGGTADVVGQKQRFNVKTTTYRIYTSTRPLLFLHVLRGLNLPLKAVSYTHLTLPTIYSV